MRLLISGIGVIAAIIWGFFLFVGIMQLEFVACVMLPETSIRADILRYVVLPSSMLLLALLSVVYANLRRPISKVDLWLACISLGLAPTSYFVVSGYAVSEPAASACQI